MAKPKQKLAITGKNADKFADLVKLVEENGDWNMNYHQLCMKWKVPIGTMYRWRDKILEDLPPIDVKKTGNQLMAALQSAIRQCEIKIQTAFTDADKTRYMNSLAKLSEVLTDMMEKYGIKEKVADKHDVNLFGSDNITITFKEPSNQKIIDVEAIEAIEAIEVNNGESDN